ncbi:unnamed protein product [Mytilus coruscus]|uniref:EB domain-containing protein n=1 Tax=Mytilus coruscus TaxID=42192 RepID=A0A6J8C873_MYTCO|nr:unnamed protein product [Mytilus coruscus]
MFYCSQTTESVVYHNRIGLGSPCNVTNQCKDGNTTCMRNCKCKDAFYADTTCKPQVSALNNACDSTDPASDQCAVAAAECRIEGTAKCLCKATHYVNSAACTIRIKPNIACTAAGQCVTHATCDTTDTNTCVCVMQIILHHQLSILPCVSDSLLKITVRPMQAVQQILRTQNAKAAFATVAQHITSKTIRIYPNKSCGSSTSNNDSCVANAYCNSTFCVCGVGNKATATSSLEVNVEQTNTNDVKLELKSLTELFKTNQKTLSDLNEKTIEIIEQQEEIDEDIKEVDRYELEIQIAITKIKKYSQRIGQYSEEIGKLEVTDQQKIVAREQLRLFLDTTGTIRCGCNSAMTMAVVEISAMIMCFMLAYLGGLK